MQKVQSRLHFLYGWGGVDADGQHFSGSMQKSNLLYRNAKIGELFAVENPLWFEQVLHPFGRAYLHRQGVIIGVRGPQSVVEQIDLIQTVWGQVDVSVDDRWRAVRVGYNVTQVGQNFLSSRWKGDTELHYVIDANPDLQKNPKYTTFGRHGFQLVSGTKDFHKFIFDAPQAPAKLVNFALKDFPNAMAASATLSFSTYIVYQKEIIARVNWSAQAYWFRTWLGGDWLIHPQPYDQTVSYRQSAFSIVGLEGQIVTPMSAEEKTLIKTLFPDQSILELK